MNVVGERVRARREPAMISPVEVNRRAYGGFCDEIMRLRVLTPTQQLLARLVAMATLKQGFNSLVFGSFEDLMHVAGCALGGLGRNDVSPAINGRPGAPGLRQLGIFQLDERSELEPAMPVTVLLVIADSTQWQVPSDGWRFTREECTKWLNLQSRGRARHTPPLAGLGAEPDLHDARAMLVPEVSDALSESRNDRNAPPMAPRSGCRNAFFRENPGHVPKVGTPPYKLKAKSPERTYKALKALSAVSLSDLKIMLQSKDEGEAVGAMAEVFYRNADGFEVWEGIDRPHKDGAKWRMRWRDQAKRAAVRKTFVEIVSMMLEKREIRQIGGCAHSLYEEVFKESF